MANKKFTDLPAATVPLSGTEIFALVQSGDSKKVAASDLPGVTSVSATAPVTSSGGKTPTVALDLGAGASLAVASNKLVRAALTGDVTASQDANSTTIANNAVSDAKFRQSAGVSVVGRSANSTGNVADIAATANGQVLKRSSNALSFAAVDLTADVTGTLPVANGGTGSTTLSANGALVSNSGGTAVSTVAPGTAGNVLKSNGTSWTSGTAVSQYFTESESTAAPNATVPVDALTVTNAAANVDAALVAKGTGATLAQVPDNAISGGSKRGDYAIDWQRSRVSTGQVATGAYATLSGGGSNTASGSTSVVGGGTFNGASGPQSTVSGGNSNSASGTASTVGGGIANQATGDASCIPGGDRATTRALRGRFCFAAGQRSALGDAQMGIHVLRRQTTDATAAVVLTADQGAPSATNTGILPNNHLYAVRVQVAARQYAGTAGTAGDSSVWELVCAVKRGANAAATALVGTVTSTTVGQDAAAAAWVCTLAVNTTTGALEVRVTGELDKSIAWVATMYTTEVG